MSKGIIRRNENRDKINCGNQCARGERHPAKSLDSPSPVDQLTGHTNAETDAGVAVQPGCSRISGDACGAPEPGQALLNVLHDLAEFLNDRFGIHNAVGECNVVRLRADRVDLAVEFLAEKIQAATGGRLGVQRVFKLAQV